MMRKLFYLWVKSTETLHNWLKYLFKQEKLSKTSYGVYSKLGHFTFVKDFSE
jgi:hypothetical protein